MKSKYRIAVLAALMFSIGGVAQAITGNDGACEAKREACVKSCLKQRADCDAKGNASDYCVQQDKVCSDGCQKAWRKCSERSSALSDLDLPGRKSELPIKMN
jgi:uncharacterized membrane protein